VLALAIQVGSTFGGQNGASGVTVHIFLISGTLVTCGYENSVVIRIRGTWKQL
jgi:hypothetical protein